ncbi:MAG: hypothetical protein ACOX3V_01640 [Bacillota bacterium]
MPDDAPRQTRLLRKRKCQKSTERSKKQGKGWTIGGVLGLWGGAFVLSFFMNALLEGIADQIPTYLGFPLLLAVVLVGVLCDGIGLASARAQKERLLAMASRKVSGAREALWFVRNASAVSSVFSDLLGDVSATVSGAIAVALVFRLGTAREGVSTTLMASIGVGAVSAMTVGGKALFKPFALRYAEVMILSVGKTWRFIARVLGGRQKRK